MGFFSWTCAKTNLPILASTSWREDDYTRIIVLFEDGGSYRGCYDGYGRVGGMELDYDRIENGTAKLVLAKFYKGESFAELGVSRWEPGQGHFHNEHRIKEWFEQGGFKTYKDYCAAYNKPEEA